MGREKSADRETQARHIEQSPCSGGRAAGKILSFWNVVHRHPMTRESRSRARCDLTPRLQIA